MASRRPDKIFFNYANMIENFVYSKTLKTYDPNYWRGLCYSLLEWDCEDAIDPAKAWRIMFFTLMNDFTDNALGDWAEDTKLIPEGLGYWEEDEDNG